MHSLCPFAAILFAVPFASSDTTPLVIPWNTTHSYGPDGPWPVVTVQVGSSDVAGTQPISTVDLYPGGFSATGQANVHDSRTAQWGITDEVGLIWQWSSEMAEDVHGIAENVLDTMRIPALHGTFAVCTSTISVVRAWQLGLPDGTYYPAQVGTLSLGAPGTGIQAFSANVNWQEEKLFLAQAPGPGVGASNIKSIGPNEITISADPIENFAVTWARNWKSLSDTNKNRSTTAFPTTNGQKGTSPTGDSKNLPAIPTGASNEEKGASASEVSSRTKAGIAIGVVMGALAATSAVLLPWIHRRRIDVPPQGKLAPSQEKAVPKKQDTRVYEKDGVARIPEIGEGLGQEADNDGEIYELELREYL